MCCDEIANSVIPKQGGCQGVCGKIVDSIVNPHIELVVIPERHVL